MRQQFIDKLCEVAEINSNVWFLTADLGYSFVEKFALLFPSRFVNVGVAEQNMIGIATGLALSGKKVFVYSIINFLTLRCFEHIRNDVSYHHLDITLVGVGGGFAYESSGYTHHAVEDINVIGSLPDIKIFVPYHFQSISLIMDVIMRGSFPSYLRLDKVKTKELVCKKDWDVTILSEGCKGLVIGYGTIISSILENNNLEITELKIVGLQCINPLNKEKIVKAVQGIRKILIIEEHTESLISFRLQQILYQDDPTKIIEKLHIKSPYFQFCGDREFLKKKNHLSSRCLGSYLKKFFEL